MNSVDIAICVFLLIGFLVGIKKGLIIQIGSLVALVFGIYGALKFSSLVSEHLRTNYEFTSEYLHAFSFLLVFLGVVVVVQLVAKLIERVFKLIALGWLNRIAGAAFSLVKFAFIISVLIQVGERFGMLSKGQNTEKYKTSQLYEPIAQLAPFFIPALTELYNEKFSKEEQEEEIISFLWPLHLEVLSPQYTQALLHLPLKHSLPHQLG